MGQAVKFAFIAAGILLILSLVSSLIGTYVPGTVFSSFNTSLGNFFGVALSSLMSVKGAINYFLGDSAVIVVFNFLLTFSFMFEIAIIPAKAIIAVYHWMSK